MKLVANICATLIGVSVRHYGGSDGDEDTQRMNTCVEFAHMGLRAVISRSFGAKLTPLESRVNLVKGSGSLICAYGEYDPDLYAAGLVSYDQALQPTGRSGGFDSRGFYLDPIGFYMMCSNNLLSAISDVAMNDTWKYTRCVMVSDRFGPSNVAIEYWLPSTVNKMVSTLMRRLVDGASADVGILRMVSSNDLFGGKQLSDNNCSAVGSVTYQGRTFDVYIGSSGHLVGYMLASMFYPICFRGLAHGIVRNSDPNAKPFTNVFERNSNGFWHNAWDYLLAITSYISLCRYYSIKVSGDTVKTMLDALQPVVSNGYKWGNRLTISASRFLADVKAKGAPQPTSDGITFIRTLDQAYKMLYNWESEIL
jgi:hypothetical protein